MRMKRLGLGGIMLFGRPGQPLLEIPVAPGRVGVVVVGGLNPLARGGKRAGIPTQNKAMGTLMPFEELFALPQGAEPPTSAAPEPAP